MAGHLERSGVGRARPLRRLGKPRAHELRDYDRNVELPKYRFERCQYGGRGADRHDGSRANARQRAEADVVQHGDAPVPRVERGAEPRPDAEDPGETISISMKRLAHAKAASR